MVPAALRPLLDFAVLLRRHGFSVSPDQTIGFIEAVGILGPRDIWDIRRSALALFAVPKDREAEFDALFRALFFGQTIAAVAESSEDEDVEAYEATGEISEVELAEDDTEAGLEATVTERLGHRDLQAAGIEETLGHFSRHAPERLPRRHSYRRAPSRHGDALDMRRTLRQAVRSDGEVLTLHETRRKLRQRKILLLIDVSGSMKERTEDAMRFAHALAGASDRFECFTLGTRLTRITPALAVPDRARALRRAAALVADIDGGTRIGDALQAFLAVPRYAGFARGAAVVVLSDGLERGEPHALIDAVRKLSRMAWRIDWLSPLAADPAFRPETAAVSTILPWLDALSDGGSVERICAHVLNLARAA